MRKSRYFFLIILFAAAFFTSCGEYSAVLKSSDYEYKYEVAKSLYADGHYRQAAELFSMLLAPLKGTSYGEESLYMLAESNYKAKDYESAAMFFKKYYQVYPKGHYMEMARFNCAYSQYKQAADIRLDQTHTMEAIREFQDFLDYCPGTSLKEQTQTVIYELQDRLVKKEYLSAKLYYDLGTYTLNSVYGGNNYEACVITSQNALKDYPYASANLREDLSILILRARYHLARQSVEAKRVERFREAIDEYYAFENDFPESKYLKEAQTIFRYSQQIVEKKKGFAWDDDTDALVEKNGVLEEAKPTKSQKKSKKSKK